MNILEAAYFFADEIEFRRQKPITKEHLHTLLYLTQLFSKPITGRFIFSTECVFGPNGPVFPALAAILEPYPVVVTSDNMRVLVGKAPTVDLDYANMTEEELLDLCLLNDILLIYGDLDERFPGDLQEFFQRPRTPSGEAYARLYDAGGHMRQPYPVIYKNGMEEYASLNPNFFSAHENAVKSDFRYLQGKGEEYRNSNFFIH